MCASVTDQPQSKLDKEALDQLLKAGAGQLTPWGQQGSGPSSPLPKKRSEHEWAVSGSFPNLQERFDK